MSDAKDTSDNLSPGFENLNIQTPKAANTESTQSPQRVSHSQINGDIQARILAFQQKRTKPVNGAHGALNTMSKSTSHMSEAPDKPLPPLPPLPSLPTMLAQQRSYSLGDTSDACMIPSPMEIENKQNMNHSMNRSMNQSMGQVMGQGISRTSSLKKQESQQLPFELLKKPSLSQRRGMKLNLSEMSSPNSASSPDDTSPIGDGKENLELLNVPKGNIIDNSAMNTTGDLTRRLSERKNKPNFKLNLSNAGGPGISGMNPQSSSNSNSNSAVSSLNSSGSSSTMATNNASNQSKKPQLQGLFANYSKYVDIKSGSLNFAGKASLHSKGIDFLSGLLFRISLEELEFLEELGHGNYGVVLKVLHKPTGVLMAMKEVRLELDETKFTQILMELEILHKCDSPYIVDFYGAFFVEGAVYMCMEYMDGGSLDKIYGKDDGVNDEACLAYITECVIRGLKELKDEHNIIHRDVKPTNILVNCLGKVKLCDFGVSGNLVASLAKTNIGCQSYMAPERIKSLSPTDNTYSVQSDIWSLGLSILEIAAGHYPYPAETYGNIFSQLSAIVDGDPPRLDPKSFSKDAQLFIKSCLNKNPDLRPSYATLLKHPWLVNHRDVDPHMDKFVTKKMEELEEQKNKKNLSRSNSVNSSTTTAKPPKESVRSLLKGKVQAPALHRGGLMNSNRNSVNR
ncbi:unnamed protein product [Debaryomyces tyrocola]|nr:unnamed protein product [Debaryomyces tyrocola]